MSHKQPRSIPEHVTRESLAEVITTTNGNLRQAAFIMAIDDHSISRIVARLGLWDHTNEQRRKAIESDKLKSDNEKLRRAHMRLKG